MFCLRLQKFRSPNSTAEKVYNAVNNGADAWAVASIIIAATGPFSIGIGAVYMLIKNQMKKLLLQWLLLGN